MTTPTSNESRRGERALVITGAAGWLGRALVSRASSNASSLGVSAVHALVRDAHEESVVRATWGLPHESDAVSVPLHVVSGDIVDPTTVTRLLASVEGGADVVHTAGVIHPARISDFHDVNVTGTANVTRASIARGDVRLVHVSSNSPFGTNPHPGDRFRGIEPYNPYLAYGDSKMAGELVVLDATTRGLATAIVRPPWFYGPFQPARQTTFFSMVKAGRFPVFGRGDQRRSMVFIDNLVDGVLAARNHLASGGESGRGWWVADRNPYSVSEIVETVGRALRDEGHTVKPNRLRLPDIVGRVAEKADRIIQGTGRYNQQVHVLGEMNKSIACDITRTTDEIGYVPRVDLYEGMRISIRWCAEQGIQL